MLETCAEADMSNLSMLITGVTNRAVAKYVPAKCHFCLLMRTRVCGESHSNREKKRKKQREKHNGNNEGTRSTNGHYASAITT